MRKKVLWTVAGSLLIAGVAWFLVNRQPPPDHSYTGAYEFDDGTLVVFAPREADNLRFKMMSGETGALWPTGEANSFQGGAGWAVREPVSNRVRFDRNPSGQVTGLTWQRVLDGKAVDSKATRLPLREEIVTFQSGELKLRGKLILPEGEGPFPVMVPVHGSEDYSAVDDYSDPYFHPAHGMAAFIYDKRGTGGSEGTYTANFHVLSDDTVAAVRYLRTRPEIDGARIHLAGYSQGGWIAPLAALKDGSIRSVLVAFGVAVPVTGEDRWGYVYALEQKGFGEDAIAEMDRIAVILGDIVDRGEDRWSDFSQAVEQVRDKPWFETAKHSDSIFGMIVGTDMPMWVVRPYYRLRYGRSDPPFIDRLYDPVQTLAKLDAPSFWIFGGKDSSAPTPWSVEALRKLQAAHRPIEYFVYPDAEHGITRFEQRQDGERVRVGYEAGYFQQQIDWFRKHNELQ